MRNGSANGLSGSGRVRSHSSPEPSHRRVFAAAAAAVFSLAAAGYWLLSDDETREIRALPVVQRQALYQRTMENIRQVCDPAPGRSVREFCRSQATLALKFPECDDDCHQIARRHMSLPRP
jgi:hypothetical protein